MTMTELLREAKAWEAPGLHITVGVAPVFRIHGRLVRTEREQLTPDDTRKLNFEITTDAQQKRFEATGEVDLSYVIVND